MAQSPRPAEQTSPLPRPFGRYVLFDLVGKGGMAEIYLARMSTDVGAARQCVIKQILPAYAERADFAEMLVREAKLAARLGHANVVQVFDLGREDETLYIAMEYVEGFDLAGLLRRCSKQKVKLPPELAFHVVSQALAGLDYAHRAKGDDGAPLGLVHRDVSPSNVLVSFDGEVKVCDFGIAHANDVAVDAGAEPGEAIKGKAGYMSPEHARGEELDARADVFAAGIVLWEMLAGRKLYKADAGPLLEQARAAAVPDLPPRGLPDEERLHGIVKKALARDRADRHPSAAALKEDLDGYVQAAKLGANPLKLGEWLFETFGEDIVAGRRERERAAKAAMPVSTFVAKALRTPEPPEAGGAGREEAVPESLAAVDVSPPSVQAERTLAPERRSGVPWPLLVLLAAIVGLLTWVVVRR